MDRKESPLRSSDYPVLTSDQFKSLSDRMKREPKDRENLTKSRVDWPLLRAACDVINHIDRNDKTRVIGALKDSCNDFRITKQFYHHAKTISNIHGFQDSSKTRVNYSWTIQNRCAKRLLKKYLNVTKLRPLLFTKDSNPLDFFTNPDASAGAIGLGSKKDNIQESKTAALTIKSYIKAGKFKEAQVPILPFHRSQIKDYATADDYLTGDVTLSDRLVLGMDAGTVIVEGQYFIPFYEHLKTKFWSYSGGDDPARLRRKIYSCWGMNWLSVDYSKFDQSVQSWLIEQVFSLIKLFFPSSCANELDWICFNFTHGNIVTPGDLTVHHLDRGIISGSFGTQAIGTLCNLFMFLSYLCNLGYHKMITSKKLQSDEEKINYICNYVESLVTRDNHLTLQGMGDDLLAFTEIPINVTDLSKYVEKIFGVKIHDDEKGAEQGRHSPPHYLKRYWRGLSGESRPLLDLFVNLVHPEHRRDYAGKGFSPWHILYGIFLTYRAAFPGVSEDWLLDNMEQEGGIEALRRLEPKDLPGALRVFGNNVGRVLYWSAKLHQAA